jgi:PAS domain S-box-containing protein
LTVDLIRPDLAGAGDQSPAEEMFRLVVEACPIGMVMTDGSGQIVMVNAEIERQFGYLRDELIGQMPEMLVPERLRSQHIHYREAFNRRSESRRVEAGSDLFGLRKDGSEFAIEVGLTPMRAGEGLLVLSVIVDVSERKAAEKHLALMEGRYRGLLEAAPDAMVVVNQGGEIVLLNAQAEKQFGYRRDELVGQKVKNIIPEGFTERLVADGLRSAADALAQQIGTGIELIGLRKDGSEFPIEIMLSPLESEEGFLVTAAIREISTRKHTERLKDEFVSTVSHELRTPLTSIAGSLGLLAGQWAGKLPESAARLLAIAHKNSQRLVRLINDILDIEKLESGRVVFNMSWVDVRPLVEQAIEDNRGFAEGYGVRVRLDDASADGKVNADPDRLAQVITNLLSNAIKFSPANGEVVVAVENNGDVVRISVRDNGPGIPADFKPHIFKKFAQADATNSRQKGGTGLGLSIVKQIIERLSGEVSFDDAPGGGTIFQVELPARNGAAGWEIDVKSEASAPRILLCEDDHDTAVAMRDWLRHAGFAADIAFTMTAALTRAEAAGYAAILVDLQLPDGNGIDLILRLRAQAQYRSTPIIVVSGEPSRGRDDARSSRLNVLGWLSKPVDFERLVRVLKDSIALESNKRPRILHVDDDHDVLAIVAEALRATTDVVSVDSIEGARRVLATDHIDLAVLDIALGTESGLDLLPELRDSWGNVIPVIIFSVRGTSSACDEQVQVALSKSQASLEGLAATIRARVADARAHRSKEVA